MPTHTEFKGVSYVGQSLISEQLECNLQSYVDWAFLCIGGFYNVEIPTSGGYGGDYSKLRLSDDRRYTAGRVWEGVRKNWVWESGVSYAEQPIQVTGVYVNGAYKPLSGTGTYAHHVDYPNGRIVFSSAIPTGSVVTCNYSYKYYNVIRASDDRWERVQPDSLRVDNTHFLQYGSGQWTAQRERQLQLPTIVVESIPSVNMAGYELGDGQVTLNQDVYFHILTENRHDRNFIHDAIVKQWNKNLVAYDLNAVNSARAFPLNANGSIASGAKTYPQLVTGTGDGGYAWKNYYMTDVNSTSYGQKSPVHYNTISTTFQLNI